MKAPSAQWTDRERLELIAAIAIRGITGLVGKDFARVRYLATMPSIVLEADRAELLEGTTFDPPNPGG